MAAVRKEQGSAGVSEGQDGSSETPVRVGVISDTHGYLDPQVPSLFEGVDLIIHAGDVGDPQILARLGEVAPVLAVAGNLNKDGRLDLPTERADGVAGLRLAVGHKRKRLVKRLVGTNNSEFDLVVFGHDHIPSAAWIERTLWLNPGSASAPYEEDELPTVAIVQGMQNGLGVVFIPLERRKSPVASPSVKHGRGKSGGA